VRREDYVRPPVVAAEPRSRRLALWRYRLVATAGLLVLLFLLLWLVLHFAGVTNGEDPGIGP
jgi:hypothetical protein